MINIDKSELGVRWYVAHTYSGYENKVKANLEKIIENRGLSDMIFDVRIPVEITIEKKGDKEVEVENKIFPSYVLIKMIMSDESWHVVRNTRGVTGFVGPASKPVPLTDEEVANLGVEKREVSVDYEVGDSVKIIDGALEDFVGTVEEIDLEGNKIRVIVSMFGRETPVELEPEQVEPVQEA